MAKLQKPKYIFKALSINNDIKVKLSLYQAVEAHRVVRCQNKTQTFQISSVCIRAETDAMRWMTNCLIHACIKAGCHWEN
jgi:hypothetical protein